MLSSFQFAFQNLGCGAPCYARILPRPLVSLCWFLLVAFSRYPSESCYGGDPVSQ